MYFLRRYVHRNNSRDPKSLLLCLQKRQPPSAAPLSIVCLCLLRVPKLFYIRVLISSSFEREIYRRAENFESCKVGEAQATTTQPRNSYFHQSYYVNLLCVDLRTRDIFSALRSIANTSQRILQDRVLLIRFSSSNSYALLNSSDCPVVQF